MCCTELQANIRYSLLNVKKQTTLCAVELASVAYCSKHIIQQTVQLTQHGKVNGVGARLLRLERVSELTGANGKITFFQTIFKTVNEQYSRWNGTYLLNWPVSSVVNGLYLTMSPHRTALWLGGCFHFLVKLPHSVRRFDGYLRKSRENNVT